MPADLVSQRGTRFCRGCEGWVLAEVVDLGQQPLPSEYGNTADEILEEFPLLLRVCVSCGLGQLGEFVLPERIFHEKYPYLSSASSSWLAHSETFARKIISEENLSSGSLVLELASNDGYLLSIFKKLGIRVLGVEPAKNVAQMSAELGIPTLVDFFGANLALRILEDHGSPDLIVANNVFAHVPDMRDFIHGISILCNDRTVVTIENPSFTTLLRKNYFDTIYHEHYSYLTAHSVRRVAADFGLDLIGVEELPTHGGSNRYFLKKSGLQSPSESVGRVVNVELEAGLLETERWTSFAWQVEESLGKTRRWLLERQKEGAVVVGYGAAHKGNTFLNSVGSPSRAIRYVVDASVEKQGKFLPGSRIPVRPPATLNEVNPTDVLILPWNIAPEIHRNIKALSPGSRVWVAQPELRELV